jgi:dihydrofolate synthase/folylpolyglutamate synthase
MERLDNSSPFRDIEDYSATLSYLYARLPMFTRVGSSAYKADLSNTVALCKVLDNPENKFKSIHIGGTNGKGSTSHMLAAILQTAGYKTGLYTSPHLRDFRERIRINGEMISESYVIDFTKSLYNKIEEIEPSFFEVTVAMAFDYFNHNQVDIAVIEVGLGGRLDSTNIINPLLSVITNIGYDHMNILGDTLPEIALEKAGIIKYKTPVIVGQKQTEIADIFIKRAEEMSAEISFASEKWAIKAESSKDNSSESLLDLEVIPNQLADKFPSVTNFPTNLQLDLTGTYQQKNLATVLSSVVELQKQGFNISADHIRTALKQVTPLTGLMGRWQTLSHNPKVICDTGHNEDGIREVLKNIENTAYRKLHMVIGMVKDKEISKILRLLPTEATYYFCEPVIPRAKPAVELKDEASNFNLKGNYYITVNDALMAAKQSAQIEDLIFVGGSTFVVAEVV